MRALKLLMIAAMAAVLPSAASAAVIYDLTLTSSTSPAFNGTGAFTLASAPSASGVTNYTAAQVSGLTFSIGGHTFSQTDANAQLSVLQFVNGALSDITFSDEIGASPNRYALHTTAGYAYYYNNELSAAYGSMTATLAPTSAVPEPAAWSLMILGFGGLGAAMRRRSRQAGETLAFAG